MVFQDKKKLTKAAARKMLTPADKQALPFLNKKCSDKNDPEFGMWQEDRIVKHITDRLRLSDQERRIRVQRMQEIDIQLSGVVTHTDEDRKRDRENKKGNKPKPVAHNLPLAYSQLDDCTTYCMSLFAPEMNIFVATSTAKKQSVAEGLTKLMGEQGQTLQYYRHIAKFVFNSLKYNLGAVSCNWETQKGIVFSPDTASNSTAGIGGQLKKDKGTVWEGNVLKSVDMYNFLYDTSVHPVDLPLRGEYYAEIELSTPFRVKRMQDQKVLFGVSRFIDQVAVLAGNDTATFYLSPPPVREAFAYENAAGYSINWQRILTTSGPAKDSQLGLELAWFTCWINPSKYDMSDDNELQLWRICMANGKYIASAAHIDDSHGQLPVACATPLEDDLRNDQRTYAEMLLPLQHFASFLLNTHVDATRKAIYGITVFDQTLFPGIDLKTDDLIGARIPMKAQQGVDIDKAFRHYNDAPQTDQNVDMVAKIIELMQKILPTNQAQQVADLERATEYQAAATVQASSRRNLKIARLINDQALSPIKFQMLYNIYENVTVIEFTGADGQTQQITPQDLFNAKIEFDVGTGLKGMDRLMQVSIFKDLMAYLFQVKDMQQQVDLLGLLSYVTQIAGFATDLSQFRIAPPPQLGPDGKPIQPNTGGAPAAPAPAPTNAAPATA